MTDALFMRAPYQKVTEAEVVGVTERGGIILDTTVFYAASGGQPGDRGILKTSDGDIPIATTVYDDDRKTILHVPADGATLLAPGTAVSAEIDWPNRHGCMRMHTALHLICSLVPYPVTGGQIGALEGRLDFDIADAGAIDKDELSQRLQALVAADHPVRMRLIPEAELDANPELVRTMAVKPPRGGGVIRLIEIGDGGAVDVQPCGGTHVASTSEIGVITVKKIEKKGKQNRRVRIALT